MALAQIWRGRSSLPSREEMESKVDAQHAFMVGIARQGGVTVPGWVRQGEWLAWANEMAGTGVNEKLGYGAEGWRFWWGDRRLCGMLLDGINSPHVYRLFDGKRKKWDGAREEVEKVNRKSEELKRKIAAEKKSA